LGIGNARSLVSAIVRVASSSSECLCSRGSGYLRSNGVREVSDYTSSGGISPASRDVFGYHANPTCFGEGDRMKANIWRKLIAIVAIALAGTAINARAEEIPLVTGEHWMKSSEELKKVYLVGIANVVQVEVAYHGASPPPDSQSFLPRLVKGLKGQTLDSVREGLDKWYAAHPDRLQRPVIETIWFEMVVPGLQKAS